MSCEQIRELLEMYSLGLLDEAEQRQVETHLPTCALCRHAHAEIVATLAALPSALAAVSPHQPPAVLKSRLLAQLTPVAAPLPQRVTVSGQPTAADPQRSLRRLRFALALVSLLLIGLLTWSIRLNVVLARERALRAEYIDLVGHQQELVLEVVDSRETTRRVLRATAPDGRAYGKVFTRVGFPHVVAMAARLDQPPPGQAYHLWLTLAGETTLAGVMKINQAGFALLIYEADRADPPYERAAVTLQPLNALTPQGPPVIAWPGNE